MFVCLLADSEIARSLANSVEAGLWVGVVTIIHSLRSSLTIEDLFSVSQSVIRSVDHLSDDRSVMPLAQAVGVAAVAVSVRDFMKIVVLVNNRANGRIEVMGPMELSA